MLLQILCYRKIGLTDLPNKCTVKQNNFNLCHILQNFNNGKDKKAIFALDICQLAKIAV